MRGVLPAGLLIQSANEVPLSELHAVMPQNVVGRRRVEIEIGMRPVEQILHTLEAIFLLAQLYRNVLLVDAVE